MSFYNTLKSVGSFIDQVRKNEGYTMALIELNQMRSKVLIQDIFKTLNALKKAKPFSASMAIARRQELQREFLNRIIHPDHKTNDNEELVPAWEVTNIHFMEHDSELMVDVRFLLVEDAYLRFCVTEDNIEISYFDGHYFITVGNKSDCREAIDSMYLLAEGEDIGEAVMDDDEDDEEAVEEEAESKLLFTYVSNMKGRHLP